MFPEYVAYLAARHVEERFARSALPNAPVEPPAEARAPGSLLGFRLWFSNDLRRLADRLEPTPRRYAAASPGRR